MRRPITWLVVATLLSVTAGCYDAKEVTEWAYVYSIGMEKGKTDKLRLTVQVSRMMGGESGTGQTGGGGGESGSTAGSETITIDCPTFYAGVNMINTFLSREINYMHTKYIVFSEDLAKQGIEPYLTAFIRGRQIRRQLYMIVSRGSASEFLGNNTVVVGSSLSKKQQGLINQGSNTSFFPQSTYKDMLLDTKSPYGQGITILAAVNGGKEYEPGEGNGDAPFKTSGDYYAGGLVRKGGSKVEFMGTALFDGGKMVGELSGDETRTLLMVRDQFKRGFFAVKDPRLKDKAITMDIRRMKAPTIQVRLDGETPEVDMGVFLEGDILAIQGTFDYEITERLPILERTFAKQIKGQLDKTVKKCQGLNTDAFRIGSRVAMKFPTIPEFEEYNWQKRFRDARINTKVEFRIRRTGTLLNSSEIWSSTGEEGAE